jgi:Serine hydrolase (FSH1)
MSKNNSAKNPAKGQTGQTPVITEKLKILCLHGYRQNGDGFKSKIGSFRKMVSKYADLVFISAPLQVPGDDATGQLSWWFNKDDGTFKGTNKSGPAIGFAESLSLVSLRKSDEDDK